MGFNNVATPMITAMQLAGAIKILGQCLDTATNNSKIACSKHAIKRKGFQKLDALQLQLHFTQLSINLEFVIIYKGRIKPVSASLELVSKMIY